MKALIAGKILIGYDRKKYESFPDYFVSNFQQ
jgi:hypothetical protein